MCVRLVVETTFFCIVGILTISIHKSNNFWKREFDVILFWCFAYMITFFLADFLFTSEKIVSAPLGPSVLIIAYFKNFAFALLCCVHPFFLKNGSSETLQLSEEDSTFTYLHLYIFSTCRKQFFDYCRSTKIYDEMWDMFKALVGVLQFYDECSKWAARHDVKKVNVLKNFLPNFCKGIYPISPDQLHEIEDYKSVIALSYLKVFEHRIVKIPDHCKSRTRCLDFNALLNLRFTLEGNWNMPDKSFITLYMFRFFSILEPALVICISRLHRALNDFSKSNSGQQLLYRLSPWLRHSKFRCIVLQPNGKRKCAPINRDLKILKLDHWNFVVNEFIEKNKLRDFLIKKIHAYHSGLVGRRKRMMNIIARKQGCCLTKKKTRL